MNWFTIAVVIVAMIVFVAGAWAVVATNHKLRGALLMTLAILAFLVQAVWVIE